MNYTLKLLIPVGIGIAAAVVNWNVLSSGTKPVAFVTVSQPLNAGEPFDLRVVKPLLLPQEFQKLSTTMIPYADRETALSGRTVRRRIEVDDPVFFRDTDSGGPWVELRPDEELFPISLEKAAPDPQLLRIGNLLRLRVPPIEGEEEPQWIGPYRIVAVGTKISNTFSDSDTRGSSGALSVGIAYHTNPDSETKEQQLRLEQFCDAQMQNKAVLLAVRIHQR